MHADTIFPALPDDETVLETYTQASLNSATRTIVLVTQFRLLISRKARSCCNCSDRSTYTSIALDSIHQVYEEPTRMSTLFILFNLINLSLWLVLLLTGALSSVNELIGVGAGGFVLSIPAILTFCITQKTQRIILSGTFGSEWLLLKKNDARKLEKQIIEYSFHAQHSFWSQSPFANPNKGVHSTSTPPPPLFRNPPAQFSPMSAVV